MQAGKSRPLPHGFVRNIIAMIDTIDRGRYEMNEKKHVKVAAALLFDKGRICERGSHEELLDMEGVYAELWHAQAKYYA